MELQWLRLKGGMNDNNFDFEIMVAEGSSLKAALSSGIFEPEVSWPLLLILREGDTFIDVGANVGYFTLMASQCVGSSGRVLAFEPSPHVLMWLSENLARNGCRNVTLVRQPATARPGDIVPFYLHPTASMGDALYDPRSIIDAPGISEKIDAVTTTIDAEVEKLPFPKRLAAIKIDVEGAEFEVLKGAAKTINRNPPTLYAEAPVVFAEWHPRGLAQMGATLDEMREYMLALGYETWWPQKDGSIPILVPPSTELKMPEEVLPANPIINLMFAPIDVVGKMYPAMMFNGRTEGAQGK